MSIVSQDSSVQSCTKAASVAVFGRPSFLPMCCLFERAISTLVTPLALHGVAVAPVTEPNLRGLKTAVVRALWGAARLSRAKEVIFTVLSKGHRVSPIMHTRYERLLWLAGLAQRSGVTQVFAQAIWESGGRPPGTGPVGRALRTAAAPGWTLREG